MITILMTPLKHLNFRVHAHCRISKPLKTITVYLPIHIVERYNGVNVIDTAMRSRILRSSPVLREM